MEKEMYLVSSQEGLGIRTKNALSRGGIVYLTDIKSIAQIRRIRNIGPEAVQQVVACIKDNRLPDLPEMCFTDLPPSRLKKKMALEIAMDVLIEHSEQEGFRERDLCAIEQLKELMLKM